MKRRRFLIPSLLAAGLFSAQSSVSEETVQVKSSLREDIAEIISSIKNFREDTFAQNQQNDDSHRSFSGHISHASHFSATPSPSPPSEYPLRSEDNWRSPTIPDPTEDSAPDSIETFPKGSTEDSAPDSIETPPKDSTEEPNTGGESGSLSPLSGARNTRSNPLQSFLPNSYGAIKKLKVSPEESARSNEIIMRVQIALHMQGYDIGTVDGAMNATTLSSMYKYQEKMGMVPSGQITSQVLNSLGIIMADF